MGVCCVGAGGATKGSEVNDQLAGTRPRSELTGTLHGEGLETERTQGKEKHQCYNQQHLVYTTSTSSTTSVRQSIAESANVSNVPVPIPILVSLFLLSPHSPSKLLPLFNLTCEICAPSYAFNPSPEHRLSILLLLTLSPVKHCYPLFQYSSTSSLQNFYNLGLFCSRARTFGKISNIFHYTFPSVKSTLQSHYQNESIHSEWQLAHCIGQFIYQGAPD